MAATAHFFLNRGVNFCFDGGLAGAAGGTVGAAPVAVGATSGTTGMALVNFATVGMTGGVIGEFL
jgi:hypothetical protein